MSAQIAGKVAAIIDDTTLVLNIGADHGVVEGMAFAIFASHGEIVDPDSGESLGSWEMVKARVETGEPQAQSGAMCGGGGSAAGGGDAGAVRPGRGPAESGGVHR